MSFISRNNCITLEDIDLKINLIGVLLNNKYVTYSWVGGLVMKTYKMVGYYFIGEEV